MSIRVYSTEYTTPLPHDIFGSLLESLPPDIAGKARRYRLWQDAHGCIFGRWLLIHALREQGHAADLHAMRYTDYGRPYLPQGPDFNISHSGHRVACIVAKQGSVGIDLEEIRDLDVKDFKNQFSPEEWQAITGAPAPLQAFYHFWTAKECLSKADGRGLNLPLADLAVAPGTITRLNGRLWHLQAVTCFPGYACHIATESPIDEVVIEEVSANKLSINALENHRNYPT